MERTTFEAMLDTAVGVELDAKAYRVADGYWLSLYVGEPGQAMEVTEIEELRLHPAFCQATSREHQTAYYLEYSSLHGICVRPPSGGAGRRAGFS